MESVETEPCRSVRPSRQGRFVMSFVTILSLMVTVYFLTGGSTLFGCAAAGATIALAFLTQHQIYRHRRRLSQDG